MDTKEATPSPRSGYPFSRLARHEGGAHMPDARCRLDQDDVVIGLDLASAEHQAVVLSADGRRLTRFKVPHSHAGLEELLRRTAPAVLGRGRGRRVFAFEATGHVWEAMAYLLRAGRALRRRESLHDFSGSRSPPVEPREDGSDGRGADRRARADGPGDARAARRPSLPRLAPRLGRISATTGRARAFEGADCASTVWALP